MTRIRRGTQRTNGWGSPPSNPIPGDVVAALDELGINVVRLTNGEAWALCPGHSERLGRPNRHPDKWSVHIESGFHSCFSCGFRGSFVTLVQEVLNVSRADAQEWVRRRGGVERVRRYLEASSSHQQHEPTQRRGWNEARLALFGEPPEAVRLGRGISEGALEHYGVLWDGENEHWILPIRSPEDYKLWGYQEKSEQGYFDNKPMRVPKGETLFGIDAFEGGTAVLLESPLDCLRLYSVGISGGLASYGASVTEKQMDLLFEVADAIVIALDNDDAGREAMRKIKQRYTSRAHLIKVINYSGIEGKDIGERTVTDEQVRQSILTATPLILTRL